MTDGEEDALNDSQNTSPYIATDRSWSQSLIGHLVTFEIGGFPPYEGVLTDTTGALTTYHLSGVRLKRQGGAHPADSAVQQALFVLLGAITLASGHVELEMKRILLTAREVPESGFADVDYTWKGLEDRLSRVAEAETDLARMLQPVLAWGAENRLRQRRNNAVHSAWALYELGHFEGARLAPKSDGASIVEDGRGLAETAELLREYCNRLQKVVRWPLLVLPPLGENVPIRKVNVRVEEEAT